ncbi:MAG: hypothetical protein AAB268_01710 [Elusimicrobiota bacterium]
MRHLAIAALLLRAMAGSVWAGQFDVHAFRERAPDFQLGRIDPTLGSPSPIPLTVPALTYVTAQATARGLIAQERVRNIGGLRVVDEPFTGGFNTTYERLIRKLESIKRREDHAPRTLQDIRSGEGGDP